MRAEYVAGKRLDSERNESILARYQSDTGDVDVLMCCLKLGEGVDLPHTRTVFLTTPTTSEIRVRQMLGRALRGPAVGGTEVANLVAFLDDGQLLRDWRDPFTLVPDLAKASKHYQQGSPRPRLMSSTWPATYEASEQLRLTAPAPDTECHEAVHARWYVLKAANAGEQGRCACFYSNQIRALDAAIKFLKQADETELAKMDGTILRERFFRDVTWPELKQQDLDDLVFHAQHGDLPRFYGVEERRACEPETIARIIHAGDLGEALAPNCWPAGTMNLPAQSTLICEIFKLQ